jgi:2-methylcitrate dehydratase
MSSDDCNETSVRLPADSNQARGLAQYAVDFLAGRWPEPDPAVQQRTELFHRDSVACGLAALGLNMNAPRVLRNEARRYADPQGARLIGESPRVAPEKAVAANCSAVRELDANGTNFGFNPRSGHTRGEFGHNDFYPVVVAAAQQTGGDGRRLLQAMICLDEIRGRLAEVFALREHKIDHVLHGALASAAVYAAMLGATVDQIESAIGLVVAHYVPFRAIRAGHQLSDSKGASAAISAETAVLAARRAIGGFVGPADIFRNPQAVFCLFEPPACRGTSPFDLVLSTQGRDFAVMGMHFKLGLYEHQSAGAIQGLLDVLKSAPHVLENSPDALRRLEITIYEPAFSIIGDPAKRDPQTRQSADHSMLYIIATLLRKAFECRRSGWRELMLLPADYEPASLFHPLTRQLMTQIDFRHGGPQYDAWYPEGIPTSVQLETADGRSYNSGLIRFPLGHARNMDGEFTEVLEEKIRRLAALGLGDGPSLHDRLANLRERTAADVADLYQFRFLHDQQETGHVS